MYIVIILRNMIIRDDGDAICLVYDIDFSTEIEVNEDMFLKPHEKETHRQLCSNLDDHIELAKIPYLDN